METESISIFMVDDNLADVETFRRYLNESTIPWDVDFDFVLKPEEALVRVPDEDFDLLILDYKFPLGDGLKLASLLTEEGSTVPVVMVTGHGNEKVASEAFKHEFEDYIPKDDVTPERLRESIEKVLDQPVEPSR